jgi:hypothetical protein
MNQFGGNLCPERLGGKRDRFAMFCDRRGCGMPAGGQPSGQAEHAQTPPNADQIETSALHETGLRLHFLRNQAQAGLQILTEGMDPCRTDRILQQGAEGGRR